MGSLCEHISHPQMNHSVHPALLPTVKPLLCRHWLSRTMITARLSTQLLVILGEAVEARCSGPDGSSINCSRWSVCNYQMKPDKAWEPLRACCVMMMMQPTVRRVKSGGDSAPLILHYVLHLVSSGRIPSLLWLHVHINLNNILKNPKGHTQPVVKIFQEYICNHFIAF